MEQLILALTVLLTGLVVVFGILILLTMIIKVYGTIVYKIQHKEKKAPPQDPPKKAQPKAAEPPKPAAAAEKSVQKGIPGEIIAAIAAAVTVMNETNGTSYSIKSVKRSSGSRPVWSTAGLMENTRPF